METLRRPRRQAEVQRNEFCRHRPQNPTIRRRVQPCNQSVSRLHAASQVRQRDRQTEPDRAAEGLGAHEVHAETRGPGRSSRSAVRGRRRGGRGRDGWLANPPRGRDPRGRASSTKGCRQPGSMSTATEEPPLAMNGWPPLVWPTRSWRAAPPPNRSVVSVHPTRAPRPWTSSGGSDDRTSRTVRGWRGGRRPASRRGGRGPRSTQARGEHGGLQTTEAHDDERLRPARLTPMRHSAGAKWHTSPR